MRNIVIIGGGAAGLMAACAAADEYRNYPCNITLIEKNARYGRKIMITGKGRCNVTNNCDLDTLIASTPTNPRFLYSAFSSFMPYDTVRFFEDLGVPLKTERGNRVFPVSDKAVDIVDALTGAIRIHTRAGRINAVTACAKTVLSQNGSVTGVKLDNGNVIEADAVIIATGGVSYPLTGSTGDGYRFAKTLGHTVTDIRPSLVPLECHEGWCSRLSGLSLKNVTLSVFENGRKKPVFKEMGEMLFTHFGISGPLALSASAYMKKMGKTEYTAYIDLKPALDIAQLDSRILRDFSEQLNKDFSNSLDKLLPKSMIPVIVGLSGISADTKVNNIDRTQRHALCELLKAVPLHITGFRPVEEAIVTGGGVSVKEIDPSTMQSRMVRGLYFAGEVIDVDALTGGFNLQIAFSTGVLAGKNAVKQEEEI